jgi:hypothetical protein
MDDSAVRAQDNVIRGRLAQHFGVWLDQGLKIVTSSGIVPVGRTCVI